MTKKDAKQNIIHAASYLFQSQGYHATGINEIIEVSGCPKGSLYYHFPNGKEEIVLAFLESTKINAAEEMQEIFDKYPIKMAVAYYVKHIATQVMDSNRKAYRIGLVALESSSISEAVRQKCIETFDYWKAIFQGYFAKAGYSEKDSESLADLFIVSMEGNLTISVTYQDSSIMLKWLEQFLIIMDTYHPSH